MTKLKLPNVTLIAVAGNKYGETIASLYKSIAKVDFAKAVLITNIDLTVSDIEVINVGGLKTWEEYNKFIIKELYKYFDTDFCLLTQWDGYVLDAEQWSDSFYEYSYIGAKWLDVDKPYNVGNGGFSFRSKGLQHILATDETIITTCPEDTAIVKVYGQYLMDKYGIKFAPEKIADQFSFELNTPLQKTFGFHAFHHLPFQETIVIKRSHALGDVLTVEPMLEYFHKKGFRVVLDTNYENWLMFASHPFPVAHISHIHPDTPRRTIELDMAYEIKPKQLRLHSYYDFASVPMEERIIRNPKLRLNIPITKETKLFNKYFVLHTDMRNEAYRNIYGVDWREVVKHLNEKGYTVIHAGAGKHDPIEGAIEMRTPTTPFLMWLIAGADGFIGIDSGISHLASAFDIPSVIFYGSVNPEVLFPDITGKEIIHNHDNNICNQRYCWSNSIGQTGTPCYIDNAAPPCTKYSTGQTITAINHLLNNFK